MSHIRSKNSKPEELVRKYLFSKGFRYRKNVKTLSGCPDIVLPKYKTVIFVNGCFWHKHDCPRFVWPSSNEDYWRPKIMGNVERDKRNIAELQQLGWTVLTVWECELKKKVIDATLDQLEKRLCKIGSEIQWVNTPSQLKQENDNCSSCWGVQHSQSERNSAFWSWAGWYKSMRNKAWRNNWICKIKQQKVPMFCYRCPRSWKNAGWAGCRSKEPG